MAEEQSAAAAAAASTKPINAEGGFAQLMRQSAVVTPQRLRGLHKAAAGVRALRRR